MNRESEITINRACPENCQGTMQKSKNREELIEKRVICLVQTLDVGTAYYKAILDVDWFLSHGLSLVEEVKMPENPYPKFSRLSVPRSLNPNHYAYDQALTDISKGGKLYRKVE
jgi:hypothetical protein